jgi:hypothetical protein
MDLRRRTVAIVEGEELGCVVYVQDAMVLEGLQLTIPMIISIACKL